ncbi:MAG: hypothetical protein E7252_05220 [Lachnospira sp.]|nr:hypothetical protein [Lachnospira sp.]
MKIFNTKDKISLTFTSLSFLIVSAVILFFSISYTVSTQKVIKDSTFVEAKIHRITDTPTFAVFVSFDANDKTYTVKLPYPHQSMEVGDLVDVYYNNKNPYNIENDIPSRNMIFIPLIFSIIIFLISCIAFAYFFWSVSRRYFIKRFRKCITARITNVYCNTKVINNGIHPYAVECVYTDPVTGANRFYYDSLIWIDATNYVNCDVNIYYKKSNPDKYFIDIAGIN